MARVTHVKQAMPRYEMIKQETKTPVMRNGVQRVTKKGRPIFRTQTVADKTKPKPDRECEKCGKVIKSKTKDRKGDPYKWVAIKTSTYGSTKKFRCEACPTWKRWELSNSRAAQVWQIVDEFDLNSAESIDDINSELTTLAEEITTEAEGYSEAASSMEDGFGHATGQTEELQGIAEELETWAEELSNGIDEDDVPGCDEHDENVHHPDYSGDVEDPCDDCQEAYDEWIEAKRQEGMDLLDGCPV